MKLALQFPVFFPPHTHTHPLLPPPPRRLSQKQKQGQIRCCYLGCSRTFSDPCHSTAVLDGHANASPVANGKGRSPSEVCNVLDNGCIISVDEKKLPPTDGASDWGANYYVCPTEALPEACVGPSAQVWVSLWGERSPRAGGCLEESESSLTLEGRSERQ